MGVITRKIIAVVLSFALGANGLAFAKGDREVIIGSETQVLSHTIGDYNRIVPLSSVEEKEKENIVKLAEFKGKGRIQPASNFQRSPHFDGSGGMIADVEAVKRNIWTQLDNLFRGEDNRVRRTVVQKLGPESNAVVDTIISGGMIPVNVSIGGSVVGNSCILGGDFKKQNNDLALRRSEEFRVLLAEVISEYLAHKFGIVKSVEEIVAHLHISPDSGMITSHPLVSEAVKRINRRYQSGLSYEKISRGDENEIRIFNERLRWISVHDPLMHEQIVQLLAPLRQSRAKITIGITGEIVGMNIEVKLLTGPKLIDKERQVALLKEHQQYAWRMMERIKSRERPIQQSYKTKIKKSIPRSSGGYRNAGIKPGRVKI